MGRSIPVELPNKTFAKQSDALKFFKEMLGRYRDGERINVEDSLLLAQLILRHPDHKIGVGIDYFYRAKNPDQPTSGFHVVRIDGEWTDFSYIRCVKGTKPSIEDYFYRACRFAVSPYLTAEKNALFEEGDVFCSNTGEPVSKDTSVYKHTSPAFKEIVETFKVKNGLQVNWEMFPPDRDRQYNVTFVDPQIESDFISHHKKEAHLKICKK